MRIVQKIVQKSNNQFQTPIKIAFLGDSVTHGCFDCTKTNKIEIDNHFDFDAVYHAKLGKMLEYVFRDVPISIINAGISGDNAVSGLNRLKNDVLSASPQLVVICYGLNDVQTGTQGIKTYKEALQNIFRELKSNDIEVIYMSPNMMNTYVHPKVGILEDAAQKCAELQNNGTMDLFMKASNEACLNENITICDCYSKWVSLYQSGVDITELLANYVNHPSKEMHLLFASELFNTILFQ